MCFISDGSLIVLQGQGRRCEDENRVTSRRNPRATYYFQLSVKQPVIIN